ncbi:MAG: PhzF family phenazine biosynthesis protein [Cypionkella sp.]|uniref:PhzF family phenazine biosynthesis protein n=1 Tax=Cypionkella sp. TaxID=2811411 RepID=UPI002ABA5E70|nr:PhzF family phenazine biosynthesis protein [Cypionkella sp.]MDZ4312617.1 PhzF family phenazine biosynthesis protein [Cypionkella sp.]
MLEFHTLDVFTETAFAGNPLAVILGADTLTTAEMQTIAREFNLSETIFVQAPQDHAHTARVRIFFPTAEIPFAGHPTVGCAIHLACASHTGDFETLITLEEEAGLVPVTVTRHGPHIEAEFTAPVLPFPVKTDLPVDLIAASLGLPLPQIGFTDHRPATHQGGPRFLYVPVDSLGTLGQAKPREPHWSALMALAEVDSAYLYTPGESCDFQARMFSPTAGIAEDPATGSASAILASQLWRTGVIASGTTRLTLRQGVEMGRPSQIGLSINATAEGITAVRIKGSAVPISSGHIRRP